ncbi:G2/mitotic-specific cyclin C13-1 isoform X2 [Rosa chinensis]|uniref:G2/mitotic-specific cyclin C13-1 isoform X2 n=1 Tax=Rosa chinensis TaxID=74649 RepID=UPI000D092B30|nr:G2/mitotic-specific cyclin C13-1 isoform X2 [Rosa chinensis]
MCDEGNSVYTTRSTKKRASAAEALKVPASKKQRSVLGEITNSPDLVSVPKSAPKKPKIESQKKEEEEGLETEIGVGSIDPVKCAYSPSMYKHLHILEVEVKNRPLCGYMEKVQNCISEHMREVLVDWLVEVAEEYKFVSDTLYLTVSYIDRYLSSHVISKNKLQLLGVACMFIASKYEEICPARIEEFCYITDNSYMIEEVLEMEKDVLKFLNFEIYTPTTRSFLRIFARAAQENSKSLGLQFEFLGGYLAELSLLDYCCVRFLPSVIAASAVFLTRFTIQPEVHPWSWNLQCYSGYKPSDLQDCVLALHDLQLNKRGSNLRAVRDKYMQAKVLEMEKDVLKFLNFEIYTPTTRSFLRIFARAAQENSKSSDLQFEFLGGYLAELSLLDYCCVRFLPSVIAASVVFLTRFTIQPEVHPWSWDLQCYSGYKPSDLQDCVVALRDLQLNKRGSNLRAVGDKYMQAMF